MCGRIVLVGAPRDIADTFVLDQVPDLVPSFNIPPGGVIASVTAGLDGKARILRKLVWGLVPPGPRHTGTAPRLINARAETIARKAAFAESFAKRRCLIPVNGFYEWKKNGDHNQPFLIRRTNGGLFALAGIWNHWEYPGGKSLDACAIITTTAAPFMSAIHHRMPLVIPPVHWQTWLAAPGEESHLHTLLEQPAQPDLITHPVDPRVSDPGFDQPECLESWHPGHDGQLDMFSLPDKDHDHD